MEKTIILLRGLPGGGKSTTAKTIGLPTFEADDFFMRMVNISSTIQKSEMLTNPVKIE
jgi:adenylate kinase family enzyme